MKSNIFLRVITCLLICGYISNAQALVVERQAAYDFANNKGQELLTTFQETDLAQRYAKLDELFKQYIDTDYIARFVAGKYWRKMTAEQQEQYHDIFVRYGLAYYKTLPLDVVKSADYKILTVENDNNFTNVTAAITYKFNGESQKIALVFRIHQTTDGIKAVDVKVAESSMLLTYRSRFYKMMADAEEEIEWFLEDFEDMTRTIENSLNENSADTQKSLEIKNENL